MQYFREVEISLRGAFKCVTKEGVLVGEPLRGVRPNLLEGMILKKYTGIIFNIFNMCVGYNRMYIFIYYMDIYKFSLSEQFLSERLYYRK